MDCGYAQMREAGPFTDTILPSYPYPLFDQLDTLRRAFVFSGAALIMTFSTVLLQALYRTMNGLEAPHKRNTPNGIKAE
jgi:hypothetical protein